MFSLKKKVFLNSLLFLSVVSAYHLKAETFYVNSVEELKNALKIASSNRDNDTIYINGGIYKTTEPLVYMPDNDEDFSLRILSNGAISLEREEDISFFEFFIKRDSGEKPVKISLQNLIFNEPVIGIKFSKPLISFEANNIELIVNNNEIYGKGIVKSSPVFDLKLENSKLFFEQNYFSRNISDLTPNSFNLVGKNNLIYVGKNSFWLSNGNNGILNIQSPNSKILFIENNISFNSVADNESPFIKISEDNIYSLIAGNMFYNNFPLNSSLDFSVSNSYINIFKNYFYRNRSQNYGGNIKVNISDKTHLNMLNNEFCYNKSKGGSVYITATEESSVFFGNNLFSDNYAENLFDEISKGSAVYLESNDSTLTVMNNTLFGNNSYKNGNGIYANIYNSTLKLINNIIWFNSKINIYYEKIAEDDIYIHSENSKILLNRNVYLNSELDNDESSDINIGENFQEYPGLQDPFEWEFELDNGSICINNGIIPDNEFIPFSFYKDLHNKDRIIDEKIDIGALEFDQSSTEKTDSSGGIFIDKKHRILACINPMLSSKVRYYEWDIDNDEEIDYITIYPFLMLKSSLEDLEHVKCIITYPDDTKKEIVF